MKAFGSAVILAGGRSTRMGFDKQLLKMNDKRVCHHLITLLNSRFDDIMVATPTPHLYQGENVRIIPDIYRGIGPLGGIHAALVGAKSEAVFTIACDMPFLELPYIDYMMGEMARGTYDACVTQCGDYLETFHAFYCRSALPALEEAASQGDCSVHRFARSIRSLVIPQKTAAAFSPDYWPLPTLTPRKNTNCFSKKRGPRQRGPDKGEDNEVDKGIWNHPTPR